MTSDVFDALPTIAQCDITHGRRAIAFDLPEVGASLVRLQGVQVAFCVDPVLPLLVEHVE
jgi:hypothetical protein